MPPSFFFIIFFDVFKYDCLIFFFLRCFFSLLGWYFSSLYFFQTSSSYTLYRDFFFPQTFFGNLKFSGFVVCFCFYLCFNRKWIWNYFGREDETLFSIFSKKTFKMRRQKKETTINRKKRRNTNKKHGLLKQKKNNMCGLFFFFFFLVIY